MNSYLFVYGTLMKDFPNAMAEFLHNHSNFVGKGTVNGILYSVTNWHFPYPIAVLNSQDQKIFGEIFHIYPGKIKKVFDVLDQYEGVGEQFSQPNEYTRTEVSISISEQEKVLKCWIYSSSKTSHNLSVIKSGNFRQFLKDNPC
ncbi:MAG: gamma-glutamylcyclotransferase [Flammeovirgaceae bacterium]|nr:gamma-glutamylcyclotransferase [Flammeovirgaceae bacterium]